MNTYKDFQAKTVDQAIDDACRFFATQREALEIEIVSGGSSGIFGLGAKKATIRAKRRRLYPAVDEPIVPAVAEPVRAVQAVAPALHEEVVLADDAALETDAVIDFDEEDEPRPVTTLSPEEMVRLEADIRTIMTALIKPIAVNVTLAIDVASSPITVLIEDEDNSGLIIGRDGQTITALQYLANRIVSKSWPQSPRIQLDAGDYRQKQEEQLLGIAQFLSEKAKKSGRVQSTRPLSSFHRRVVHMALQDDRGVQTRSKGEGHMKRVLILPVKRGKPGGRPPRRQEAAQARQS
ncbi:spoIIIJ-associated protein [Desulfomicrobium norvegicum]|uniref:RNA-binding protein KhpB n=1 Tax=Desulfomicrobium norvegicum (strain DSM 1741 / NCIMB 8310) TaxID=52561 RepID=A0A8G2C1K8_DESNO|nr:Jag N-terminal domain-containing protein [Desulfomicrobium norvegicum]SFL44559.1 spoIIIJ-associated protein [Desulfomicrobium norvegicum]